MSCKSLLVAFVLPLLSFSVAGRPAEAVLVSYSPSDPSNPLRAR
jgi:hypothetical protein